MRRSAVRTRISRRSADRSTTSGLPRTAAVAHDASRAFHLAVAKATGNDSFLRLVDSLWIADVGRRLLARRRTQPDWQDADVAEHAELLAAIEAGDGDRAESIMREHVASAWRHWSGSQVEHR